MTTPKHKVETLSLAAIAKLLGITEEEADELRRKKILVAAGRGHVETVASIQRWANHMRRLLAEKKTPPKYTSADIAEWTGYTARRIQQLVAGGVLPGEENGAMSVKRNIHALIAHLQNLAKSGAGKSASEARETKVRKETEWIETKLAERRKQLMPVAVHKTLQGAVIHAAKMRLLGLPNRIVETLKAEMKQRVHTHATTIINEALQELSEVDLRLSAKKGKR